VSDNTSSFPTAQNLTIRMPASMPTAYYEHPVSMHGIFPVTAGSHTFYVLAQEAISNNWAHEDEVLTLMFFPTAYGTVDPMLAAAASGVATPTREREESEAFHSARVERELAAMRARLGDLERQLRQTAAEQAASTAAAAPR
jgi:hypothetical protein